MNERKIYGLSMTGLGLFFVIGAKISGSAPDVKQDLIITIWGLVFITIGVSSFFWEKIVEYLHLLWRKIIPATDPKKIKKGPSNDLLTRFLTWYYTALGEANKAKEVTTKPLSKNAQKRLARNNKKKKKKFVKA
jgi:hypothetical protein